MNQHEDVRCKGEIELVIEWQDGRKETHRTTNTVLYKGRQALAASLADEYGEVYQFFISRMLFGDGGTTDTGDSIYVTADRNGLFNKILDKPVSRVVDPNASYQVVFTSVITYEEANGSNINEMALQMNTGDLYSMATFGNISKSPAMQLTWSWRISFI